MENYGDYTYNARNLLKRFSHRRRFSQSIKCIPMDSDIRLLDFGCGDGLFLNRLKNTLNEKVFLIGYEPFIDPILGNNVTITASWEAIVAEAPFDYITCFEVLEHFDAVRQAEALKKIFHLLSDEGCLIVSVPIENGFPSLIKNLIRKFSCAKRDRPVYSIRNMIAACLKRPLPQYRTGTDYLFSHMGFYSADLEKVFLENFVIIEKRFSPFPLLGSQLNSQIFYRLKKMK